MASTSEVTFGARIANAETISANLKTFTGYIAPTPETTIAAYDDFIAALKTKNGNVATKNVAYSAAIEERQNHFRKHPDSVAKILSPIAAALRAKLGKSAKEVDDITGLIVKIRGEKTKKPKTGDSPEQISQSERSFGSMTQKFSDIVTTLQALGSKYAPVKTNLQVPALQTKLADITTANNAVSTTYSGLKTAVDLRSGSYTQLSATTQRVKEAIKSQYGLTSTEYKLVKGLRV